MNLLDMLMDQNNSAAIGEIAKQFNLDQNQTQNALGQIVPALAKGLQNNAAQGGLGDLMSALGSGDHQRYLDDPSTLSGEEGIQDGNNILGQILGSKDVSRQVASQAAAQTGLDAGMLKQMLPMIASMAMGVMSKNAASSGMAGNASDMAGMLTGLLDADKDGSVVDDLMGMAGKFFR
ncbi:MAG: DUF937 domain-containing protein [Chromatiales bacterium]|nr:DUF937 domain-containing protein [Chromatiales bacterium]